MNTLQHGDGVVPAVASDPPCLQCVALRAQLAQARAVLEECRPLVKARLAWLQDNGQWDADDSILTRIEQVLKGGAPAPKELTPLEYHHSGDGDGTT